MQDALRTALPVAFLAMDALPESLVRAVYRGSMKRRRRTRQLALRHAKGQPKLSLILRAKWPRKRRPGGCARVATAAITSLVRVPPVRLLPLSLHPL